MASLATNASGGPVDDHLEPDDPLTATSPLVRDIPPSEQRLLGRLVLRLIPKTAEPRAEVRPDDLLDGVRRWHWYASAGLLMFTWVVALTLERVWPAAKTSVVSLAAAVAGIWMDYTVALGIFTGLGMMYFMTALIGNPYAGVIKKRRAAVEAEEMVGSEGDLRPRHTFWSVIRHVPYLVAFVIFDLLRSMVMIAFGILTSPYWAFKYRRRLLKIPAFLSTVFSPLNEDVSTRLRRFALREEQIFREGVEDWSILNRIRICLVFGAVHFLNLVYPVAVLIPLCGGAACFMGVYLWIFRRTGDRRQALIGAGAFHYTYNRLALGLTFYVIFPGIILGGLVFLIFFR